MTDGDGMPSEANRPDGAPARKPPQEAPSKAEAEREARRHLREQGCTECGEDDPDILQQVNYRLPDCPAVQSPPPGAPQPVYCDDCLADRETLREEALRRAREKDVDAVVFYECQNTSFETFDFVPELRTETASVGLHCRCGARLDEVAVLSDDGGAHGGDE